MVGEVIECYVDPGQFALDKASGRGAVELVAGAACAHEGVTARGSLGALARTRPRSAFWEKHGLRGTRAVQTVRRAVELPSDDRAHDASRRPHTVIWDVHCHFPRNWENPDDERPHRRGSTARADALRAAGVVARLGALRAAGTSRGPQPRGGAGVPAPPRGPDAPRRIHMPMVDVHTARARRRSSTAWATAASRSSARASPIDDYSSYFHMYAGGRGPANADPLPPAASSAAASTTRSPTPGATRRPPSRVIAAGASSAVAAVPRDVSAMRMRPFHLDTIANNFPDLPIIGAHMGGTGNYDEASSVARWRHNVVFDLSGGETIERHAMERRLIGREIGVEKLVWGSDCGNEEIGQHVDRFRWIFEAFGLSDEERERIWYGNAAELFGEAEPVLADEQPTNRPD